MSFENNKESGASSAEQSAGKPAQSINVGVQPLNKILEDMELKNHDLVEASTEGLTHKQVNKARKGRRVTRNIQDKIIVALSAAAEKEFKAADLFTYR